MGFCCGRSEKKAAAGDALLELALPRRDLAFHDGMESRKSLQVRQLLGRVAGVHFGKTNSNLLVHGKPFDWIGRNLGVVVLHGGFNGRRRRAWRRKGGGSLSCVVRFQPNRPGQTAAMAALE